MHGQQNTKHKKSLLVLSSIKAKAFPIQTQTDHYNSRRLSLPEFLDRRHMKVARYAPAAFISQEIPLVLIGNLTRDLQACSEVPQITAPMRAFVPKPFSHGCPNGGLPGCHVRSHTCQFYILIVKNYSFVQADHL